MAQRLEVDTRSLDQAADDLIIISAEFDGADTYADVVGAAVGHAGLAQRLSSFTDGWKIRRGEIEETVWGLAEVLRTTANAFEDTDSQLAANVRGDGVASGGGGGW